MSTRHFAKLVLIAVIISLGLTSELALISAQAQSSVARAVLFYSPSCPHCQKVTQEVLPPLREKYGDQLAILEVNVSTEEAQGLYLAAVERYAVPEDRRVVPLLFIGDQYLIGSREIPEKLPGIIEAGIATGGIPWPDIPGLSDLTGSQAAQISDEEPISPGIGLLDKFSRDPIGNFLAVVILIGLSASAIVCTVQVLRLPEEEQHLWSGWIPFALIGVGLGIALYLSYVELTHTQLVCGPVGDCNTVQQSPYARLFGVIPVGVLGVAGYLMIGVAWIAQKTGVPHWKYYGALAAWALTLFGVLFFIYLTFLEPFVIGAACAWCLTGAVVMILLLWASTPPAIEAWKASENN